MGQIPTPEPREKYCQVCHRTHLLKEFYTSNNLEKYPDGKLNICKKQITMNVDNWDPETYLPILQECDVPYIPKIWNNKLLAYGQNPAKVTGLTIIGRYLSTMKIKPNDKWRWKDTQYLQEIADKEVEEAMRRQGYEAAEIDKIIRENRKTIPDKDTVYEIDIPDLGYQAGFIAGETPAAVLEEMQAAKDEALIAAAQLRVPKPEGIGVPAEMAPPQSNPKEIVPEPDDDYFDRVNGIEPDNSMTIEISDEEKRMYRLKWGKAYKIEEWLQLERFYNEMTQSYDIHGAGHIDTLKKVCKTSLKADQLLDIGDRP